MFNCRYTLKTKSTVGKIGDISATKSTVDFVADLSPVLPTVDFVFSVYRQLNMFNSVDFVVSGLLCRPNVERPFDFVAMQCVSGRSDNVDFVEFDSVASVYRALRVPILTLLRQFFNRLSAEGIDSTQRAQTSAKV